MSAEMERKDLEWLVDSRSKIHRLLFDLWCFNKDNSIRTPSQELQFQLLMAAGFALWRATFLAHGERNWSAIHDDSIKFLGTLVRDNAIAYVQDRESKAWTFGYYVNDAYFRLDYYKRFLNLGSPHTERITEYLDAQSTKRDDELDAHVVWNHAFEAARVGVDALSSKK